MQKRWFCLFLITAFVAPLSADDNDNAKDWPSWRGPLRDGICREKGLLTKWPEQGPKLVWNSLEANDNQGIGIGYSSVSVADGRVFTMGDHKGKGSFVYCLDEKTGKILWETRIDDDERDGPRSTPTVDGDRVYALSRDGDLACLDVANGKILWEVDYKEDLGGRMMSGWDYSESILIDGDRLICTPGGNSAALAALDKKTGDVIWKAPIENTGGSGYASIVISKVGGVKQYLTLLGRSRGLVSVRAKDGQFLWSYNKIANGTANIPTPIVRGDLVFASTGYGQGGSAVLQMIPTGDGGVKVKELWYTNSRELQNHHGGVVLVGDYLYGGHGHNNGQPFCVDFKTGNVKWLETNHPGRGSAAVVYADGHLYFRYTNGTMALIEANPDEFRVKSTFQLPRELGTPSWPHPVIANGKLFIRGKNNVVLCYDLTSSK